MRDWGNMPKEIVTKFAEHVEFYEDFVRLKNICTHWRSAAKDANFRACVKTSCSDEHTLPLLMLPEIAESSTIRRLYSLSKHMVCRIELPSSSSLNIQYDKKRLLSAYGWLLVLSERTKHHFLFNPFTKAIIEVPRINLYHTDASDFKLCLSANPSTTCDFTVFVSFYDFYLLPISILHYRRNGDHRWTRVTTFYNSPWLVHMSLCFTDVTYYKGEFYGTNEAGLIVKFQTALGNPHFQATNKLPVHVAERDKYYHYLAESLGQLLVIRQVVQYYVDCYRRFPLITRFQVFALDFEYLTFKEVLSLGNRSIFIGSNSSFSVEVSPSLAQSHGFKPNCIYYINNWGGVESRGVGPGGRDYCVYNLAKRAFETDFHNGFLTDFGKLTPFTWVEPPMYYFN